LYLSLILLPGSPAPNPAALTMAAGLAVLGAVRSLGASDARLKWPNDILVGGAKLAGILVESRGLDPERPHAVVGIGLNVLQREFPAELVAERAVTSLVQLGLELTRERALETLLDHLQPRMDQACRDPAASARDYAAASELPGRSVRVQHGRQVTRGRMVALSLAGLELELAGGARARIPLEHALAVEAEG